MPTTYKLSPVLRQRFFDANGVPLAGGLLNTYAAGTSTPKATYTDSTGGVLNANPVVLDANGYCDVWLPLDNTGYKFVLHDASNNLLWTIDQVNISQNSVVNSIVFQNGSSGPLLTLQPPTPITPGGYTLTMPTVPVTNPAFVTMDTSGNLLTSVSTVGGITNNMITANLNANKFTAGTQLPILTPAVKVANYNPVITDGEVLYDTTSGALSGTLYTVASAPGYTIRIKKTSNDNNILTISANGLDTINGSASTTLATQNEVITLINDGIGNWNIISRSYPRNWVDGGVTVLSSTGSSPAKGNGGAPAVDKVYWRRSGNTMIMRVQYKQTNSGSAGSGGYKLGVPGGWAIDTSLVAADTTVTAGNAITNVSGFMWITSTADAMTAHAIVFDSTHLSFQGYLVVGGTIQFWGGGVVSFASGTLSFGGLIEIPIANWNGDD